MDDASASARSRGTLLLAVIFFLGMVCGAALFYLGQRSVSGRAEPGRRPPGAHRPGTMGPVDTLAQELDLDPEQREKLEEVFRLSREQLHEMMEQTRLEIREQLRPDQQEKFDNLRPHRRGRPGRFPRGGPGGSPRRPLPPQPGDGR